MTRITNVSWIMGTDWRWRRPTMLHSRPGRTADGSSQASAVWRRTLREGGVVVVTWQRRDRQNDVTADVECPAGVCSVRRRCSRETRRTSLHATCTPHRIIIIHHHHRNHSNWGFRVYLLKLFSIWTFYTTRKISTSPTRWGQLFSDGPNRFSWA